VRGCGLAGLRIVFGSSYWLRIRNWPTSLRSRNMFVLQWLMGCFRGAGAVIYESVRIFSAACLTGCLSP